MKLTSLRKKLNVIDNQLLKLLSKRQQVIVSVVKLKKNQQLKIHQPERELEIINHKTKLARKLGLNPKYIKDLFQLILTESKNIQRTQLK